MLKHFVSASCGGEVCPCGKQATHKLGEEIPWDEPCMSCGQCINPDCAEIYHVFGQPARHNLTAYVCCACFTQVVGVAAGCPLTDLERRAVFVYHANHDSDQAFLPPGVILCPRCDGELVIIGSNTSHTAMFVECSLCRNAFRMASRQEL